MIEGWADVEGDYRWTLGRRANDRPLMLVVGHNPSTADARKNDPTVLRWLHFALTWGHGGYIAVNLYPFRSSSPAECRKWLASGGHVPQLLDRNVEHILEQRALCSRAVVCWGKTSADDKMVHRVVADLTAEREQPLYCFGTNDDGSPKHVMARGEHRIENSQKPVEWDYQKYRAALQPAE
jgi:hypothetical protein